MHVEEITYTDYDNVERKEKFYFNLTKAELVEMELSTVGGLEKEIQKIVDARDTPSIIKIFKRLILQSYGEKSDDGRRFIKSEELSKAFSETEAYSELFTKLATDADAAVAFVNGIIPKDLREETNKKMSVVDGEVKLVEG